MCVQKSHHMDMYAMPCPFRPIMLRSRSIKLGDKNSQLHQISQSWTTHMLDHIWCWIMLACCIQDLFSAGMLLWRFIWNGDKAVTRAFRVSRKYNPVRPLQKCGQSAGVWSPCQADLAPHSRLQRPTAVWRVRKSGKQQPNLASANQTQQPPPPTETPTTITSLKTTLTKTDADFIATTTETTTNGTKLSKSQIFWLVWTAFERLCSTRGSPCKSMCVGRERSMQQYKSWCISHKQARWSKITVAGQIMKLCQEKRMRWL